MISAPAPQLPDVLRSAKTSAVKRAVKHAAREMVFGAAHPSASGVGDASRIGAVVVLAIVPLWLFGRGILAAWARQMAARRMSVWAISEAQGWLARSARLDPDEAETEWMQAVCFRRLGEVDRWGKALQSAQQKGTPAPRIQQEAKLGLIQSGQLYDGAEFDFDALIEAGTSQDDVAAAFVRGYLVAEQVQMARLILDAGHKRSAEERTSRT